MSKVILDAYKTEIIKQTYSSLEDVFREGLDVNGTDAILDFGPMTAYPDDAQMGGVNAPANRVTTKITAVRFLAPLLRNAVVTPVTVNSISPSITLTSGSFTDLTGATVSYEQMVPNQVIEMRFDMSAYSTAVNTGLTIRAVYDGVTCTEFNSMYNGASTHGGFTYAWIFTGAATAGTKTAKIQWRRSSGAGTLTLDSNDYWALTVR